jgi:hypothetical protein
MRFEKYTDSRWLTIGGSARTLTAPRLLGLDSLVAYIRAAPSSSDYYVGGYSRLSEACKHFTAIAALCSYVGDGFLAEVMEDIRVPMRWQQLRDCIYEDMSYVASISEPVLGIIGSLRGARPFALSSHVISAAHTSAAFIWNRVLLPASRPPRDLCHGGLAGSLACLRAADEPGEPTSRKIWRLLKMGYNMEQLIAGLKIMQDCPWSSAAVGQAHRAIAALHKARVDYGIEVFTTTAYMHQA